MARHMFIPRPIRQGQSTAEDVSGQERHNVYSLRELFRNGDGLGFTDLNVALNSSRWKVSDIVEMGVTYEEMYAFLLRDTTNGIEYMFVYAGRDSTNSAAEIGDFIAWDGTNIQKVVAAPTTPYTAADAFSICVFINVDYATSSWGRNWGFDNATEMTYTGGDYEDITAISDPSGASTWDNDWVPAGVSNPRGCYFSGTAGQTEDRMLAFVLDDVEDALACYSTGTAGQYWQVEHVMILSKNLFNANTAGDIYLQGMAWWDINPTAGTLALETHAFADGFTNAGVAVDNFALSIDGLLSRYNEKTSGLHKWRSVVATSVDFDKGWINSNLAIEVGSYDHPSSYRQRYAHPDTSNPCCKYENGVAFMWAPNIPSFPFAYDGMMDGP